MKRRIHKADAVLLSVDNSEHIIGIQINSQGTIYPSLERNDVCCISNCSVSSRVVMRIVLFSVYFLYDWCT